MAPFYASLSEKAGLKLNIQKTKIMAPGPITSWQIDGEKVETVTDFIFLVSKVNPVDEGTKRRVTDTPVHHSVKAAGSTQLDKRPVIP